MCSTAVFVEARRLILRYKGSEAHFATLPAKKAQIVWRVAVRRAEHTVKNR
jgi:hypothetical protein